MVETGHNHHHAPPMVVPNLAISKGPIWTPAEQLLQLQYCIHSNPSLPQMVFLSFQHYLVMLGTLVAIASYLVPLMGGTNGDKARVIQTLLFMAGLNTLLQTILGTRLPTVMRGSYAFVIPVLSIIRDLSNEAFNSEHERFVHTMRTIQGSMIIASFLNIIIGYGNVWGHMTRHFSPVLVTPLVCLTGLGLFARGFPVVADCVAIGLPMLILLLLQQYLKHLHLKARPILERFGLLVCFALIWAFAAILTAGGAYDHASPMTQNSCRTDRSYLISSAPWVKIPYPFQWGAPIFRASHIFAMMGAALVTSAESTGAFFAASRLSGATHPPGYVFTRSVGLQGVSILLDGIFGAAVGTTASVENVGLLGLTHIGSRRMVQLSTAFMFFFSIFGKFGALFASIPLPIFGAVYCVLFGIVAAIGISYMQFANNNSMRNHYVLGVSLFLGSSISQYFISNTSDSGYGPVGTGAGWFNDILNAVFSSPPTVALIVGGILDNVIEAKHAAVDRGMTWWSPFQHRDGDPRTEEFYNLPLVSEDWIPSRFRN